MITESSPSLWICFTDLFVDREHKKEAENCLNLRQKTFLNNKDARLLVANLTEGRRQCFLGWIVKLTKKKKIKSYLPYFQQVF